MTETRIRIGTVKLAATGFSEAVFRARLEAALAAGDRMDRATVEAAVRHAAEPTDRRRP